MARPSANSIVLDNLPEALAQGVFVPGARYPVIARLANVPGEIDRDGVATQRGFAFKLLDVAGHESCPATKGRPPRISCSIRATASRRPMPAPFS